MAEETRRDVRTRPVSGSSGGITDTFLREDLMRTEERPEAKNDEFLAPHNDFDLQIAAIKDLIIERTKHWRFFENFFYGLVIILLLLNMAMVLWLAISR